MKHIIFAIDESAGALAAVRVGVDIAERYQASVELVHSVPAADEYVIREELGTRLHDYLDYFRHEVFPPAQEILAARGIEAEEVLLHGPPVDRIPEHALERGADLIVIGHVGLTGIRRLFIGSVAKGVTDRAPCPVLVVRVIVRCCGWRAGLKGAAYPPA